MKRAANTLTPHQLADLAVLCVLAALVIWYFLDACHASVHIINLILILPVTVIVLILCLIEFINQLRSHAPVKKTAEPASSMLPVMGLFMTYVLTLQWLGFDVGTCLFVCAFLYLHGERRWQWITGYGLCFSLLMASFFSAMLPYPMPMLLFPTAY